MRKKLIVLMIIMLILPSFPINAESDGNSTTSGDAQTSGVTAKDEVIYATLTAKGTLKNIYVVNILDVDKAGTVIDYGAYSQVENLTNLSDIEQLGNQVKIDAPEGRFYYQGNMTDKPIPWDIAVTYQLDGEVIMPEELLGAEGQLEINIHTTANENVNEVFYNNYLLQISLTLDTDVFASIEAEDATIANAGEDKQLTFTVMPEKDGDFTVKADVTDFEMQGIEISAVPSSMAIDSPNTDDMTNDIKTLTEAIADIHAGVSELRNGVSQLNEGMHELRVGSHAFHEGIGELDANSSELIDASTTIEESLVTISRSLNEADMDIDMDQFSELLEALPEIADGLEETADWVAELEENYSSIISELDETMDSIPDEDISEDIKQLYENIPDDETKETLDQLVDTYNLARIAKDSYARLREELSAIEENLDEVDGSISDLETTLAGFARGLRSLENLDMLDQLTELQDGMDQLASNYGEFHNGLEGYMKGVSELSNNYGELDSGIEQTADGTSELESGVNELHDGTGELHNQTKNMPDELKKEINEMMDDYDKSDFEPVSFVSDKNEQVNNVQFILKTDSISMDDDEDSTTEQNEQEQGFWARLVALFKGLWEK